MYFSPFYKFKPNNAIKPEKFQSKSKTHQTVISSRSSTLDYSILNLIYHYKNQEIWNNSETYKSHLVETKEHYKDYFEVYTYGSKDDT